MTELRYVNKGLKGVHIDFELDGKVVFTISYHVPWDRFLLEMYGEGTGSVIYKGHTAKSCMDKLNEMGYSFHVNDILRVYEQDAYEIGERARRVRFAELAGKDNF